MLGTYSGSSIKPFLPSPGPLLLAGENLCSQLVDFPLGEAGGVPRGGRAAVPIHPRPLWIRASTDVSVSQQAQTDVSGHVCRCVAGIFWMSECAKASQYAFIFLYISILKEYFGEGKSFASKVFSPSPAGLMHLSWAVSWPDALPVLERAHGKQRRKLGFYFYCFLNSFFPPAPATLHWLGPQKRKHFPCSMCFFWGWNKLQET